jgi:hypothetical protein
MPAIKKLRVSVAQFLSCREFRLKLIIPRENAMASYIYRDANLNKQLRTLRRAGGIPALVADHAETILNNVHSTGGLNPRQIGRMTRYGEARIKNCVKYDLVHGYRLIGVMRDREMAFVCVGTHDECDRWLKNNSGNDPVMDKKRNDIREIQELVPEILPVDENQCFEEDCDEDPLSSISQQDLRIIFRGLCGGQETG